VTADPRTTAELAEAVEAAIEVGGDFRYEPVGKDGAAALAALVARAEQADALWEERDEP
jgi:hypothetical protein